MKTIFLILVVVHVHLICVSQNYAPVRKGNPLEDAGKSLNGATAMSLTSCVAQGIGYFGTISPMKDNDDSSIELKLFSWMIGIGGIGMETNTPILTSKAKRQIKNWDCPQGDLSIKQKMIKKIGAAQTISIVRTVLPAAGLIAMRLFAYDEVNGEEKAKDLFYGFWAASLIMVIPEIILIEEAHNEIRSYQNSLQLSPTEEGLGLIYRF
jgi:hypothetical protein